MVPVGEDDWLAERFETHRPQLRAVAYRMLGSASEADDAVQEVWIRLHRSDITDVQNFGGWLTTVIGRICLDMLRSRKARHEEPLDARPADTTDNPADRPEQQTMLADSVGVALLVVLDTLSPAERLAFVLHDIFAVPYPQIAPILDRTPAATKMLTSRARHRIRTATADPDTDPTRRRAAVTAFLAASRGGDFDALLALLDPHVVLHADRTATRLGGGTPAEIHGAAAVAAQFSGRAQAIRPALLNGAAGAAWASGGRLRIAFAFTITNGKITAIDIVADPEQLDRLDVEFLTN
jgi:RNA polymerase sigma factor (sigma-70 family)